MIDYKEIHKKPYHFTLERLDPEDERVPFRVHCGVRARTILSFLPA